MNINNVYQWSVNEKKMFVNKIINYKNNSYYMIRFLMANNNNINNPYNYYNSLDNNNDNINVNKNIYNNEIYLYSNIFNKKTNCEKIKIKRKKFQGKSMKNLLIPNSKQKLIL